MKRFPTLKVARAYLKGNFINAVTRTKRLYVELAFKDSWLRKTVQPAGYFEPTLLCLCWCDYLGALFTGNGKASNDYRIVNWLKGPMAKINPLYRVRAELIHTNHRNGLVHGYSPRRFRLSYGRKEKTSHLTLHGKTVHIHIPSLLRDLECAIRLFANNLKKDPASSGKRFGSLEAMEKGYQESHANS